MGTPQQLHTCESCDGSGVEVYGITIREPGCAWSHDSSDERTCPACGGSGFDEVADVEPDDDWDDDGDFAEDMDDCDPGEECGRWVNGRLSPYCSKAGSEECDFECPYRGSLKFGEHSQFGVGA